MHRTDDGSQPDRAAYEAPRLTVLGSLGDLTLGPLGANEDGPNGFLDSDVLPVDP